MRAIDVSNRLRRAARQSDQVKGSRPLWRHSFSSDIGGAKAKVQIDHIDDQHVGGITITIRHLNADAAEAVLRALSGRNQPNGGMGAKPEKNKVTEDVPLPRSSGAQRLSHPKSWKIV